MGYRPQEIIGQHFSRFYPEEAQDRNWPATELEQAARDGRVEDEGWRVRKDGSRYWANVIITALRGPDGRLRGFSKIARDLTEQRQMREQLRILAARMESTREQEATRIAHQIHDELGQAMTGLKLDIELAKRQYAADDPVLAGRFDAIIESVRAIMTTIRNIATELRPVVLDQLGLPAAIEWLAKEFESRSRTRFQIDFPMRSVRMSEERKTAAFRILREVLINIVRHADAANVRITAQVQEGRVIFEVADDGRGITEAEITDYKSFGLMAMRHRASMVGGEVHVRPREGGGTIVTVTMPLEPAQE
jgi:PAS domain S-box-containing protein